MNDAIKLIESVCFACLYVLNVSSIILYVQEVEAHFT